MHNKSWTCIVHWDWFAIKTLLHSGTNNIIGLKYCTVLCNNDVTSFEILVCDRMKFPIMHYMLKQEIVSHKIISHLIVLQTYAAEGRFTFTSHSAGEHVICLHSNSSAWFASGQLVSCLPFYNKITVFMILCLDKTNWLLIFINIP